MMEGWDRRTRNTARATLLVLGLGGCGRKEPAEDWRGPPPEKAKAGEPIAESPDRLPPGELMEGPEEIFGFRVPKGMTLSRPTRRSARIAGRVDFAQLTDYVRARIGARHAELLRDELVFPKVVIRGGDPKRIFEVRLKDYPHERIVLIRDKTPLPKTPGLTEEDRWNRVGLKPGGQLIDPNSME